MIKSFVPICEYGITVDEFDIIRAKKSHEVLAGVPALSCRCMTYAYLNSYVSKSSMDIATCLPVVYFGYLQPTMATCSLLLLPAIYYGYLWSTLATCGLLWLPMAYYGYL